MLHYFRVIKNVTITLDEEVARWARILSAKNNTSVSRLVGELNAGLGRESARKDIRSLLPWRPIAVDRRVLDGAWHIQDRFGLSWWDALIVSAAQASVCHNLLTGDPQDGQVFGNLRIIDPFETMPETLES